MRLKLTLAIIALAAATPAAAQNETADPAATPEVNAADANAVVAAPTDPAATQAMEATPLPADDELTVETDIATEDDGAERGDGFPWGLIGLVGLVGLLGRRRSS